MHEYILKYGENAIQLYKKSLRLSESLDKDHSSPIKQEPHLLPKKSLSKKSLKSHISKKNDSHSKLPHSKSIKNTPKFEDQPKRKASSFLEPNKKPLTSSFVNGFGHTFNKFGTNPNQGKKKLVITQSNLQKCSTPKMHINLDFDHNKQQNSQKQPIWYQNDQKDKLTERIQRSSGKKNGDKCSTSQSKHQTKRSCLKIIESQLYEMMVSSKPTLRSLGSGMKECFEALLINEESMKFKKIFLLMKDLFQKIGGMGEKYKQKYNKTKEKMHSMQALHEAYNQEPCRKGSKVSGECKSNKKQKSIETIIMSENYDLRRKVGKLEKQLEYFTSQNASLNNVFGKFKNSESQLRFKHNLDQNGICRDDSQQNGHHSSVHKQQGFSGGKMQKRRSSENLLYNQGHDKGFGYGLEKRLSFDPGVLQIGSEAKRVKGIQFHSPIGPNTMYNSVESSEYNDGVYCDEYNDPRRPTRQHQVEELSEEEDSQNEE